MLGFYLNQYAYIFDEPRLVAVPGQLVVYGEAPNPLTILGAFSQIFAIGAFIKIYLNMIKYKKQKRKEKFLSTLNDKF